MMLSEVGTPEGLENLRSAAIDPQAFGEGWRAKDSAIVASRVAGQLGFEVFPTLNKRPLISQWQFKASRNLADVFGWRVAFLRRWGLACEFAVKTSIGSGLWIVDVDGPLGRATLAERENELGPLPETIKVHSGRLDGGFHLWFKATGETEADELRTMRGTGIWDHIDVRGWHGYAVLPGCTHSSGRDYCYAEGCAPDEVEIAELPAAWYESLPKHIPGGQCLTRAGERKQRAPQERREHAKSLLVGDGPGYGGFNDALYRNAIQFFFQAGAEAPSEPLVKALRDIITDAPKDPGRDVSRYMDGSDLPRLVDRARMFVQQVKGNGSDYTE